MAKVKDGTLYLSKDSFKQAYEQSGITGVSYKEYVKGDDKHSYTHVIVSKEEWKAIRDLLIELQEQVDGLPQKIANAKAQADKAANDKINAEKAALSKKTIEWAHTIEAYKQAKEDAEALNVNLLRICKENANAKRKLRPKKQHPGYRARKSRQADRIWYDGKKRHSEPVWRSTIETPYSILLTEEQARPMIAKDIKSGGTFNFTGDYYTEFKMLRDMDSGLWNIELDTEEEFKGIRAAS